jgi:hexosaminidase
MTNPRTTEVIEDVWEQLSEDFSAGYLHIGMDELNTNCGAVGGPFEKGTYAQKVAYVAPLFKQFAETVANHITTVLKRKVMLWQDSMISYGVTFSDPSQILVHLWNYNDQDANEKKVLTQMCKDGYKLVNSNYFYYYLDCGGTNPSIAAKTWCDYVHWQNMLTRTLETDLPEECQGSVLGGSINLWTEMVSEANVFTRTMPRIWAFGERLWTNSAESAPDANTPAGFNIWKKYLPYINKMTMEY